MWATDCISCQILHWDILTNIEWPIYACWVETINISILVVKGVIFVNEPLTLTETCVATKCFICIGTTTQLPTTSNCHGTYLFTASGVILDHKCKCTSTTQHEEEGKVKQPKTSYAHVQPKTSIPLCTCTSVHIMQQWIINFTSFAQKHFLKAIWQHRPEEYMCHHPGPLVDDQIHHWLNQLLLTMSQPETGIHTMCTVGKTNGSCY